MNFSNIETCKKDWAKKPKIVEKKYGTVVDVSSDNKREQQMCVDLVKRFT